MERSTIQRRKASMWTPDTALDEMRVAVRTNDIQRIFEA